MRECIVPSRQLALNLLDPTLPSFTRRLMVWGDFPHREGCGPGRLSLQFDGPTTNFLVFLTHTEQELIARERDMWVASGGLALYETLSGVRLLPFLARFFPYGRKYAWIETILSSCLYGICISCVA